MNKIAEFIKTNRKEAGLTQEEFAIRSGLGLRFVRELEQGKETDFLLVAHFKHLFLFLFSYLACPSFYIICPVYSDSALQQEAHSLLHLL